MKFTATWLWRTRASPGPGSPTLTSSRCRTSGPPVAWKRMACAMLFSCRCEKRAASAAASACELLDESVDERPRAEAGGGIQVADVAEVDQFAAPGQRES